MKKDDKLVQQKKKNKKAFTLIELLAVIIILGVLMVIAVPAVTNYIDNSKKDGYIDTARRIIAGAGSIANSKELGMSDRDTTYYIPAEYIKTDNGLKSPYGEFTEAYVGVIIEGEGYKYYWISNDSAGKGIKEITSQEQLESNLIESNIKDEDIRRIIETTGIDNREKIQILNLDGTWNDEVDAINTLSPSGKIERLDLLNSMFLSGPDFNAKIKQLANGPSATISTVDTNIIYIRRSLEEPTSSNKESKNIVSTVDSEVPIYAWFENGTLYWWTKDAMPHLNQNAVAMYCQLSSVKEIEFQDIKTDQTTIMASMFNGDQSLEQLDLSGFDTSHVGEMWNMFAGVKSLKSLDLSAWDTSSATDMYGLFNGMESLEYLDISNFDTSNVFDMGTMFASNKKLKKLDLSSFDTSNVTNMNSMFYEAKSLEQLNISSFNTSKVTDMGYMFYNAINIETLDLSNFNTSKVTDMNSMFAAMSSLNSLNINNFNTSNVTDMSFMFSTIPYLTTLNLSNFNTSKVTKMNSMFAGLISLKSLDLSNFDTSKVTDMNSMFYHCTNLESINLSSFNTSNVTNMLAMFDECPSLKTLDVSSFNTSKVTDMEYMFSCDVAGDNQLTSIIGLENFDTSNVVNMSYMFYHRPNLHTLDLSSFNTSKVKYMVSMFAASNYTTIYTSPSFVITGVTSSSNMFSKNVNGYTSSDSYVLTGGAGTTYSPSHVDKEYARIDDPENNRPGYFTLKTN